MITDEHLVKAIPHPAGIGGTQRIYRFAGDFGLSAVNSPVLHFYSFAWEVAVLKGVKADGSFEDLTYDTPLTDDVMVFSNDEEANDFIQRAADHFSALTIG